MEKEETFKVVRDCITENSGLTNANLITWNSMWKDCQIGSSLEEFCVVMEIEKKLNISIPDEMVFKWLSESPTMGEIVDYIESLTN